MAGITKHNRAINFVVSFVRQNPGSTNADVRDDIVAQFDAVLGIQVSNGEALDELNLIRQVTFEQGYIDDATHVKFRNFLEALTGSQTQAYRTVAKVAIEKTVEAETNRLEESRDGAVAARNELTDKIQGLGLVADASPGDNLVVTQDMIDGAIDGRQSLRATRAAFNRVIDEIDAKLALLAP